MPDDADVVVKDENERNGDDNDDNESDEPVRYLVFQVC